MPYCWKPPLPIWPAYQPLARSCADGVVAGLNEGGDVVGLVADAFVDSRSNRGRGLVADALAVDGDFVESECGGVEGGVRIGFVAGNDLRR